MRAAPALRISIERFGQWRAAVAMLAAAAAASLGGWLATRPDGPDAASVLVAAVGLAAIGAAAVSLLRNPAATLHWDGRAWRLGPSCGVGAGAGTGEGAQVPSGCITVEIDLGAWMLLRFRPAAPPGRMRWLPVQRAGLEADWHALRCAVHAAAPRPLDDAPPR